MKSQTPDDVWIGLDVGKDFHYATVISEHGDLIFEKKVNNAESDLLKLFAKASLKGSPILAIDQPGSIAKLSITLAKSRNIPIAYIPGLVMRRAADLYPGNSKTDRRDSFVIADTARIRKTQVQWIQDDDEQLLKLRILNGVDIDLGADRTRQVNRLRDAITSISPSLEKVIGEKLSHFGILDLLKKCPTPALMKKVGRARLKAIISKRSPRLANKLGELIWEAIKSQDTSIPGTEIMGNVISDLALEVERLIQRRKSLELQISQSFQEHPIGPNLITMPGIGPRTGARILAEIGDITNFANGSKLAAYAGLAPVTRQSGTSIHGQHRSRRGNHRLKNAMFLSAFASLSDPDSKEFYERKRSEGKRHNAAIICLARRRCDVIFKMITNNEPYLPKSELVHEEMRSSAA